jgi:acetyl-CoA C-acetyltransferase
MMERPLQGGDVVICEPLRTPVGRYGGALKQATATQLAASLIVALLERTGVDPGDIDEVVLGQCYPNGEAPAIGRVAALDAGLPTTVTGMQLDRRCGSGLMAVITAVMQVASGTSKLVLAGGVESMSQAEFYATGIRWGNTRGSLELHDRLARGRVTAGGMRHPVPGGMLETAENLRREYRIPREEQDQLAAQSHERAVAAQQRGDFDAEIVSLSVPGAATTIDIDEHPRPGTTVEKLASLRPVMLAQDAEATVTAGNSSGENDGAAMCVVTTRDEAERQGMQPYGRLVSWAVAGVPPSTMGIGPVPASHIALERAGLRMNDVDLIELNEAFAAQVLACTREWNFGEHDRDRLNVNGSGISLGHPVGATGARILATLLREMRRREVRYGLETLCIGGGQGIAAIFESDLS